MNRALPLRTPRARRKAHSGFRQFSIFTVPPDDIGRVLGCGEVSLIVIRDRVSAEHNWLDLVNFFPNQGRIYAPLFRFVACARETRYEFLEGAETMAVIIVHWDERHLNQGRGLYLQIKGPS